MAQIYTIKCPKCGKVFEAQKGILVSRCGEPVPDELKEETPVVCPLCKLEIDLQDPANEKHILSVIMVD